MMDDEFGRKIFWPPWRVAKICGQSDLRNYVESI